MHLTREGRPSTLRERKRERTRAAIVAAGTKLFATAGYDATTIADIAAAADIGTRTFFSYFSGKEELLFPEHDRRIEAALGAIARRAPDDRPVDVLLQALAAAGPVSDDLTSATTELRLRLMESVPAVRGRALHLQRRAEREIAAALCEAYPDQLDAARSAALVGAFIGAAAAAANTLLHDPDAPTPDPARIGRRIAGAVAFALGQPDPSAEVRLARRDEGARIAQVWLRSRAASVPAIPPPVHSDQEVRAWFEEVVLPSREVWVAETGGTIIALLVLDGDLVDQLYVDPIWTGRGVGSRLLGVAKERRPAGLNLWTFQANVGARRFYERHGFVATETTDGDNEEGAPDVRYEWPGSDAAGAG